MCKTTIAIKLSDGSYSCIITLNGFGRAGGSLCYTSFLAQFGYFRIGLAEGYEDSEVVEHSSCGSLSLVMWHKNDKIV